MADQTQQEDFAEEDPSAEALADAGEAAPASPQSSTWLSRLLGKRGKKTAPAAGAAGKDSQKKPQSAAVKAIVAAAAAPAPAMKTPALPGAKVPMPGGALYTVVTRNEFYRDGFRNMVRIVIAQSIIVVVLLVTFILYMSTQSSQDRYFATTADGRIMQLTPLDQANMSEAALMSWVAQAASEVMTFGYHDYQRRLQQSSRHFTHHGWETFTAALNQSHIIDGMMAGKQVLNASPRSAPVLKQEGVFNGKYRWIVQLPIQVRYEGEGANRTDNLNVTLVIERVPSLENPNGVGIEQWISTQG